MIRDTGWSTPSHPMFATSGGGGASGGAAGGLGAQCAGREEAEGPSWCTSELEGAPSKRWARLNWLA